MSAEWILQGYAYDPAELAAFVGSKKDALAKKIARAAKELHEDDRPWQRVLDAHHARSRRVWLAAHANRGGNRRPDRE